MTTIYFEQIKPDKDGTHKRYKVVSFDEAKGTVTLQAENGTFVEKFDKEHFKRMGYKIVKVEE